MNPQATFLGYWPARALMAGVRLGLFDQLALGPQTAAQLAAALRLHPDGTARLCRALSALGFLAEQEGRWANAPVTSASLVRGAPHYIGGIAHHHADLLWPLWDHLETAVREGRPVLPEAFGGNRNPYDLIHQSPAAKLKFLAGMDAGSKGMGEGLAATYDFSRHRHLIDVGGGPGSVTGPVAVRYPHLQVTVFDLPAVVEVLPYILGRYGCGSRLTGFGGDFFRPETFPAGADGAVIARVLHNWSDERALQILRNTWLALPTGGVVLVLEYLRDSHPMTRPMVELSDLMMLLLTDGGRERSAAEYQQLLAAAGFGAVQRRQIDPITGLLIGVKP